MSENRGRARVSQNTEPLRGINSAVIPHYLSKGSEMHNEIEKWRNEQTNDNPVARAELARTLVKKFMILLSIIVLRVRGWMVVMARKDKVWLKLLMQQKITI